MPRGRPKGSKNKPKVASAIVTETNRQNHVEKPVLGLTEKKKVQKESQNINPNWVLTKTCYGTPIAIESIMKGKKGCFFMVIPNYTEKTYKTTVDSRGVIKPNFDTPEKEKEFEGIKFWEPPQEKLAKVAVDADSNKTENSPVSDAKSGEEIVSSEAQSNEQISA